MICNPSAFHLIHKIDFIGTHIGSILYLSADILLNIFPLHREYWMLLSRCTISNTHASFIKPYSYLFSVKLKSFSSDSILFFQKGSHFLRCLSLLILGINTLAAVIPASAAS